MRLLDALRRTEGVGDPLTDADALAELIRISSYGDQPIGHSDFVLAVDGAGNVAAVCHSINTSLWGQTGLFVDGVSIPDAASFQQAALARLGSGAHLPFVANPAIALREGAAVLASSSIGAGLHPVTVQCLHAVLGLGLPIDEVVRRPLFHGPDTLAGDTVNTALSVRESGAQGDRSPSSPVIEDGFGAEILARTRGDTRSH
ncbi:MAG TPA: hypothetical protein VIJ23_01370 [Mycobacterium sp.]